MSVGGDGVDADVHAELVGDDVEHESDAAEHGGEHGALEDVLLPVAHVQADRLAAFSAATQQVDHEQDGYEPDRDVRGLVEHIEPRSVSDERRHESRGLTGQRLAARERVEQ